MSSKTRDESVKLIFDKVKLLHVKPGAHGPLMKIQIFLVTISRIIQISVAIKLIANNTNDILVMAKGAKTIAVMMQVLNVIIIMNLSFNDCFRGLKFFHYYKKMTLVLCSRV